MAKDKNSEDSILDEIKSQLDIDGLWDNLVKKKDVSLRLEKIGKEIQKKVEKFARGVISEDAKDHRGSRGKLRKTVNLKTGGGKESHIERLLALNKNVYNQFNLMSGLTKTGAIKGKLNSIARRINVDLVVTDSGKTAIKELVELKAGSNKKDNPLSALVQIITYYYLFREAKKVDKNYISLSKETKLTLLAPEQYYKYWKSGLNGYKNNIIDRVQKGIKGSIKISIEKIGLSDEKTEKIVKEISNMFRNRKVL